MSIYRFPVFKCLVLVGCCRAQVLSYVVIKRKTQIVISVYLVPVFKCQVLMWVSLAQTLSYAAIK